MLQRITSREQIAALLSEHARISKAVNAICDLEESLGIEVPDEMLTKNVFSEIGILVEFLETYMSL